MRGYMRELTIAGGAVPAVAEAVGMDGSSIEEMYRLLAIAKYEERFVIPQAHAELASTLAELGERQGSCGLEFPGGPGSCVPEATEDGGTQDTTDLDLVEMLEVRRR
jgi:nitrate reductase beta subunit